MQLREKEKKELKSRSVTTFDNVAASYDDSHMAYQGTSCHPYLLDELHKVEFDTLLDVGCGTGSLLKFISEVHPEAKLYGVDLSENMLDVSRENLEGRAQICRADAEHLYCFFAESFDVVTCVLSFHHYPEPEQALKEMMRVLKPGGTLILCDPYVKAPLRQITNTLIGFSSRGDVKIYSQKELTDLMISEGYTNTTSRLIEHNTALYTAEKPFS